MKISTRLLFIAALFVLALPLVFTGDAGAAGTIGTFPWVQHDGASLNANGGYQIDDPGFCNENAGITNRQTCTTTVNPNIVDLNSNGTQDECDTYICADGVSANMTDCNNAGYKWFKRGTWNSTAGECRGAWGNINFYTWTGNCSGGGHTNLTACTTDVNNYTWTPTNVVYPNGHQSMGSDRQGCLHCHSDAYMYGRSSYGQHGPNKDRFLLHGHRNMLRKAPGHPDGPAHLGNVDWTSSMSTVLDKDGLGFFATVPGASEYTLNAGTYYVYGGWYRNKKSAQINRTTAAADAPSQVAQGASYCGAACHTTGAGIAAVSSVDPAGNPATGYGTAPDGAVVSALNWYYDGIQCARCHKGQPTDSDYFAGGTVAHATAAEFQESTELCFECHEQATTYPYQVMVSPSAALNTYNSYANFTGHYRTNMFLASPHAKFSGTTHELIADPAEYASLFLNTTYCQAPNNGYANITDCTSNGGTWNTAAPLKGTENEGCVGCHDVHISSVDPDVLDPTNSLSPIHTFCQDCHEGAGDADAPQVDLAAMNHPTGTGTPFDFGTSNSKNYQMACVTCHMGPGTVHLFSISTDPAYSPFVSGSATAQVDPALGGNLVSMSVDLACGHCHGGSGTAKGAITPLTVAQLAEIAPTMHGGSAAGVDCTVCHTMVAPHHALGTTPCLTCHTAALHTGVTPDPTCSTCHVPDGPTGPNSTTHHVTSSACSTCHTQGGVTPDPDCATCHDGTPGPVKGPLHHVTTSACTVCHGTQGGIPANPDCATCHTSTPHVGSGHNTAPYSCTDCHGTIGGVIATQTTAGTNVSCSSCHVAPTPPVANFTATCDASASGRVNLNAASSSPATCPADATSCAFAWTGTNCTNATGATTQCDGAAAARLDYTIAGGTSAGTSSKTLTLPACVITPDAVCGTGTAGVTTVGTRTVTFTVDGTTDTVTRINWGDTTTTANPGYSEDHTYAFDSTYAIRWTVENAVGKETQCGPVYWKVSAQGTKHTVTVNLADNGTLDNYTAIKVWRHEGGLWKVKANGGTALLNTWTSGNLNSAPGYVVQLLKYGRTFTCNGTAPSAITPAGGPTTGWTVDLSSAGTTLNCTTP